MKNKDATEFSINEMLPQTNNTGINQTSRSLIKQQNDDLASATVCDSAHKKLSHLLTPQPLHWSAQDGRSLSDSAPTIQKLQWAESQKLESSGELRMKRGRKDCQKYISNDILARVTSEDEWTS